MDTTLTTLTYICDHIETHGRPPTVRHVATHLGCSTSTAHDILNALTTRGLLELAGPTRALTLTEPALIMVNRI